MSRGRRMVIAIIAIFMCQGSFGAELAVSIGDMENLGIELANPRLVDEVNLLQARARVLIPPANQYLVSASQPGLITRLWASPGDRIEPGQLLAEIQSPSFLALQRAFLEALNTDALAAQNLERDQQLYDEGIIAKKRLQETRTEAKVARARYNESRQLLAISGVEAAELAELAKRQKFMEVLPVRSAIAGTVLEQIAVTGQQVEALSPVYRIGDLSTLWLDIPLTQDQLAHVDIGKKVTVANSDAEFSAEITAIGSVIDPTTQSVSVRAVIPNADNRLKPGQYISVRIVAERGGAASDPVWAVPVKALVRSGTNSYLFVRSAPGFEVRKVYLLGTNEDEAYVAAGVAADTQFAVTGIAALKALWTSEDGEGP